MTWERPSSSPQGAKFYSEAWGPPQFQENALGVKRPFSELSESSGVFQDDEKGGLGLRGVPVTTKTATTAETAKTVKTATVASLCCILKDMQQEGKVLSRTAKTVMKATPLKPNPPFPSSRVFSEQLSELEIPFSEYEIPFSEWPLTTWSMRNPQFSEQLPNWC